ncbi:hypothetical protein DFQ14_102436 [Halopolyspora algeriensis]|uniref:DUF485 domain-containing protein n=1 Tax=Halopolyspora algeriensis TaxID=1500506 RepID=A0A368VVL3_9ACTN|nr:hypothetical protein [Halopolyspora algeriensis]RCW46134.1 hypothetical protein DFQ14_102436 [Halopolyspora algeriensis]TQM55537.1 hypothetical protein FHU43_0311 [Halopolyspora algeriensis]
MTTSRRVAVTSPQTRLARSRRRTRGHIHLSRWDLAETERATALYRAQRRRALPALLLLFTLLFGLPVVFAALPQLDTLRLLDFPLSWLALGVLPYPAMVLLSWWQLRRAERIEERR